MSSRSVIHLALHFVVPAVIAAWFFRAQWRRAWLIMVSTMIVDLDHLLADPVYDPNRCSMGFHPLHSPPAIAVYVVLLFPPKTRIFAIGLLVHMALDSVDCGLLHWW